MQPVVFYEIAFSDYRFFFDKVPSKNELLRFLAKRHIKAGLEETKLLHEQLAYFISSFGEWETQNLPPMYGKIVHTNNMSIEYTKHFLYEI